MASMDEERMTPNLDDLTKRERPGGAASPDEVAAVRERALLAAHAAAGVKADEVKVLDMHEVVTYTDFLVLCTGRNTRLTKRIAEEVGFRLKTDLGLAPAGTEGTAQGEWILLDYLDFVVHVFTPDARAFYRLDVLWKQAPAETVE
ncbi:MAG: ribosome silencing factor [Thermoleophilia bacterium]|nr:ribosome silencing factor [Thermoleophilia bacterium]